MKNEQSSLSAALSALIDRRAAGDIGPASFTSKKRHLLRLPPQPIPKVLTTLLVSLALNALVLVLVVLYPASGKYFLALLFFMLFAAVAVLELGRNPGFSSDLERITALVRFLRRVLCLDLTDRRLQFSGNPSAEMAALRYLRDTGELSKQEFSAGRAIVEERLKPIRWVAFAAFVLTALNIAVLVQITTLSIRGS